MTALLLMHFTARIMDTGAGVFAITVHIGAALIGAAVWAALEPRGPTPGSGAGLEPPSHPQQRRRVPCDRDHPWRVQSSDLLFAPDRAFANKAGGNGLPTMISRCLPR